MAFLPGYDVIGMHAITLLAVFRCLQGLALGGSWDGLPSLLALNAPPQRRGWYAMLGQLGAPIGFMVASALFLFLHLTLTQADFLEWGWRYPFFVAFAINVVALFARLRLVVTEEYTQLLEEGELEPIAIVEIVRDQGYNLFLGAFAALASYALFHLVTVFPLSWIAVSGTQQISDVLIVQTWARPWASWARWSPAGSPTASAGVPRWACSPRPSACSRWFRPGCWTAVRSRRTPSS